MLRAKLFVDGFNLYYPIHEHTQKTGENYLKWLDLQALGSRIASARGERLVGTTYCTAYKKGDSAAKSRHRLYNAALRHTSVEILFGHYIREPDRTCDSCGGTTEKYSEKQTDINVALALVRDAYAGEYDVAYLLSADSDQAATAEHFKLQFPDLKIISVVPPNRDHSERVMAHAHGKFTATIELIKASRFPSIILRKGENPIRCPAEYDTPR